MGVAVVGGLGLYAEGVPLLDRAGGGWSGVVPGAYLVALCLAVVVGIAVAVMAVQDQWTADEVTGPVLRLRAFGDEDEDKRYYAAVDDGSSRTIRAWKLDKLYYERLTQGQLVTVTATPNLGRVRWIGPVPD
jgi:hypothetical protein